MKGRLNIGVLLSLLAASRAESFGGQKIPQLDNPEIKANKRMRNYKKVITHIRTNHKARERYTREVRLEFGKESEKRFRESVMSGNLVPGTNAGVARRLRARMIAERLRSNF